MLSLEELSAQIEKEPERRDELLDAYLEQSGSKGQIGIIGGGIERLLKLFSTIEGDYEVEPRCSAVAKHLKQRLGEALIAAQTLHTLESI